MKKLLTNVILFSFAMTASAQSLKISGDVSTPTQFNPADLAKLPQTEVSRKDRDGKDHLYTGVSLSVILQQAGASSGKELKGKDLSKYVTVEAKDGYQVLFSLVELNEDFNDKKVVLATKMDGQPLALADGPFRVIVEKEKKPARCIKQVTAIKVAFAK